MSIERDPLYLHPALAAALPRILEALKRSGREARLLSAHRIPEEQLDLYKRGRILSAGRWSIVKKSEVVTYNDGTTKPSRHNHLPALAFDLGLFDGGRYLTAAADYADVGPAALALDLEWGGDWKNFKDTPHVQLPVGRLLGGSPEREAALQWQAMIKAAGAYAGALDGLWGPGSRAALLRAMGTEERTPEAWSGLCARYGQRCQS